MQDSVVSDMCNDAMHKREAAHALCPAMGISYSCQKLTLLKMSIRGTVG